MPESVESGSQKSRLSVDSNRLLLVEGKDEVFLLSALIRHCFGNQTQIQVIEAGGKDQFPESFGSDR